MAPTQGGGRCLAPPPSERLHATAQEAVGVALHETLLLPLDDLLAVTREFIHPEVSRSGLARGLRRHMVRNLPTVSAPPASASPRVPTRLIASAPPTAANIA